MSARPIIIDCDPGLDDAVALFLAFAAPDALDILGITTVAGNVPLASTQRNARIIRQLAGREDVPVHAGAAAPLSRAPVTAEEFHGESGLDGIEVFEPAAQLAGEDAVGFLIDTLRAATGPKTLVVTGPMTNIALALERAPDIPPSVNEIIVMAGADAAGGNITPHAEFNVFADPHAADIVFSSGVKIVTMSLDVTHQIRANEARIARIAKVGTSAASHVADLLRAANRLEFNANSAEAAPLHDPSTIAYLLAPDLFAGRPATVRVETQSGERFGRTVVDYDPTGRATWIETVDADGVFDLICERLAGA